MDISLFEMHTSHLFSFYLYSTRRALRETKSHHFLCLVTPLERGIPQVTSTSGRCLHKNISLSLLDQIQIIEIIIILPKCPIIQPILCVKFPVVKFWRFLVINLFHDVLWGNFFPNLKFFPKKSKFPPILYTCIKHVARHYI